MQPLTSRKKKRMALIVLVLLAALSVADYLFYPLLPIGGQSFNSGNNGVWLKDSWWRGTEKQNVDKLAAHLKEEQIRYAYFHVRFIKKDGTLRFRGADYAQRALLLNARLKKLAPSVKTLAWVYIGNERGLTGVDLNSRSVRRAIAHEAAWLCKSCGFDGVQWDYEICANGEAGLLKLLDETRMALPRGKMISVATALWLPSAFWRWGWSEDYFTQVAARSDQLAIMGYDSLMIFPRHYVWLMKQQVWRVSRAAMKGNPQCRVILGVPTYEDGGRSHHLRAENLRMALKAARACGSAPLANMEGLAIFADYSTDAKEWKQWRELWLN